MTHTPLTEQQLDEITTAVADYRRHVPTGWACCSAHPVADAGAALLAEVRRLSADLAEMTHCRDNALRALYRDDVETDIDLEETIAAPFYGPGWDWDDDGDMGRVVREAAAAIRPAFGKLTQERDRLRADAAAGAGQAEATLDRVRRIASRLAAHAVGFGDVLDESDRGPWGRTVGADIAELSAALSPDTAPAPASAPLDASHSPAGDRDGETGADGAAGRVGDSGGAVVEPDAIHLHFGLSYANYLVLPRTLLQSMDDRWQTDFVAHLDRLHEAFRHVPQADAYKVEAAEEHTVSEMSPNQLKQAGITEDWYGGETAPDGLAPDDLAEWQNLHEQLSPDYYDADGDELDEHGRVLIPVADPVPHYNRGRTRIEPAAEVTHIVADDSDDPEHVDDCPGCAPATEEATR